MFGCETIVLALIVCGFYYFVNGIDKFFADYRKKSRKVFQIMLDKSPFVC